MIVEQMYILSQRGSDEGDWIKFVFGGIVFLFWIISAIATWFNKRQEEERRRRLREQFDRESIEAARQQPGTGARSRVEHRPSPPIPIPPVPAPQPRRRTSPQPPPHRRPQPPAQPSRKQRLRDIAPPPIPVTPPSRVVESVRTEATTQPVSATEISTGTAPARARGAIPGADAASIARWLRPQTLQHQFILTEILQPPLALREPREG